MSHSSSSSSNEIPVEKYYTVEHLVDIATAKSRQIRSRIGVAIHIKWEGYDDTENTWEPIENLNVIRAVELLQTMYVNPRINASADKRSLITKAIGYMGRKVVRLEKERERRERKLKNKGKTRRKKTKKRKKVKGTAYVREEEPDYQKMYEEHLDKQADQKKGKEGGQQGAGKKGSLNWGSILGEEIRRQLLGIAIYFGGLKLNARFFQTSL